MRLNLESAINSPSANSVATASSAPSATGAPHDPQSDDDDRNPGEAQAATSQRREEKPEDSEFARDDEMVAGGAPAVNNPIVTQAIDADAPDANALSADPLSAATETALGEAVDLAARVESRQAAGKARAVEHGDQANSDVRSAGSRTRHSPEKERAAQEKRSGKTALSKEVVESRSVDASREGLIGEPDATTIPELLANRATTGENVSLAGGDLGRSEIREGGAAPSALLETYQSDGSEVRRESKEGVPTPAREGLRASNGDSPLTAADRVRFVQRVTRAVEAARPDGEIRLRLRPPELGSLHLRVKMEGGALTAHIETETLQAREVLNEHLHDLRERLTELDIRVERFDVEWRGDASDQEARSTAGHDANGREPRQHERPPQNHRGETKSSSSDTRPRSAHRGDLDVLI